MPNKSWGLEKNSYNLLPLPSLLNYIIYETLND